MSSPRLAPALRPLLALALGTTAAAAQNSGTNAPRPNAEADHAVAAPSLRAVPKQGAVTVDGRLDEAAWATAEMATGFKQSDPNDGEPARLPTEVRFVFDADALYIGARMYDSLGAQGVRPQLVRRDQFSEESDWLRIFLDTFHDHLVTVEFSINASGARQDSNNGDTSWDPVWESATNIDGQGWTAELRIPFSQLRYPRDEVLTWGLQVVRFAARLNERSHFVHWYKNESGGAQRYAHLREIRAAASYKRIELLPYVVTRNQYRRPTDGTDPFQQKVEYDYRVGADLKYLLTQNLTLNATINPDFGQVEADPAVINLSAFETSFPEKRPFFIEGGNYFGFGGFSCFFCSNVSSLGLFYTRRIGRQPQVAGAAFDVAGAFDTSYVEVPENTTILGAAKITGRAGGWQVGILDALTREEKADILYGDGTGALYDSAQIVEPRTNYFVGRVRKDLRGGNLQLGGIATSVIRNMNDDAVADRLPQYAEAVGFDWRAYFRNRTYRLQGNYAYSQVRGEPAAIVRLQQSSARYYQRPDRDSRLTPAQLADDGFDNFWTDAYDPRLDHLRGHGGYTRIAKDAGNLLWESMVNWRSPGFEVNDIAFNTRSDYVWANANLAYNFTKPTKWFRTMFTTIGGQRQQNFDGDVNDAQLHAYIGPQLPNYWYVSAFYMRRPELADDRLLRGGPVVRRPASNNYFLNIDTDSRKKVVFGFYPNYGRSVEGFEGWGLPFSIRYKPTSNVAINFNPYYGLSSSANQYVDQYADSTADLFYDRRYIVSNLKQHIVELSTRVQWTFTPTLSLETVLTPLFGSVNYYDFKEYVRPRSVERVLFGSGRIDSTMSPNGQPATYTVDPDGPGQNAAQTYTFSNPDFNFRSLLGNAVLRWEYLPGSTLFVVWQQNRSDSETLGEFDFSRSNRRLWGRNPHNIFLVKVNYWLNL